MAAVDRSVRVHPGWWLGPAKREAGMQVAGCCAPCTCKGRAVKQCMLDCRTVRRYA